MGIHSIIFIPQRKYLLSGYIHCFTGKHIDKRYKRMKLFLLMAALALNDVTNALDYGEKPSSRISGPNATEAKPHSKPWMVNLPFLSCGGTLIGRRFVLTALHCTAGEVSEGKEIILGDHDKTIPEQEEQRLKVKTTVPYKINEIADDTKADYEILVLEKEAQLNKYVQIVNLPKPGSECPEELEVCGWGNELVDGEEREVDKLMCVDQICRPSENCPNWEQLPEYKRCASFPGKPPINWLNSACGGDSGGPLFHTDQNGLTTIYGVVSRPGIAIGHYCNGPTIYASVSHPRVLEWIKDTMAKY